MNQFCLTIPVMPVRDIDASCEWYADILELRVRYKHEGERGEEPTNYAVLERDGVQIHLILDEPPPFADSWTAAGSGYLYLQVRDIEKLCQRVQAKDVRLTQPLAQSSWGANGFEFRDPDGNLIRIEQNRS